MKRRLLPSLLLALALTLALAPTACAAKPTAPTATDFEVRTGGIPVSGHRRLFHRD